VEFVDAYDASEAQYHMNRQMFAGREITVVLAADTRKRPEDMRRRTGPRYADKHLFSGSTICISLKMTEVVPLQRLFWS
jgi:hypothetical protein